MASRFGIKGTLRWMLSLFMIAGGINHFVSTELYVAMMPQQLPWPVALVYLSGGFEILGGAGLSARVTRRMAAWGLVALLIAVFPANINMAIHTLPLGSYQLPPWALWARLPLQAIFIAWAWWYTHGDSGSSGQSSAKASV
jgi:uncharacterized membrane protein